jgi:hypothetical protein
MKPSGTGTTGWRRATASDLRTTAETSQITDSEAATAPRHHSIAAAFCRRIVAPNCRAPALGITPRSKSVPIPPNWREALRPNVDVNGVLQDLFRCWRDRSCLTASGRSTLGPASEGWVPGDYPPLGDKGPKRGKDSPEPPQSPSRGFIALAFSEWATLGRNSCVGSQNAGWDHFCARQRSENYGRWPGPDTGAARIVQLAAPYSPAILTW